MIKIETGKTYTLYSKTVIIEVRFKPVSGSHALYNNKKKKNDVIRKRIYTGKVLIVDI